MGPCGCVRCAGEPEKLGDVLRRERPELFAEVQMPDGVDENTRIEVPASWQSGAGVRGGRWSEFDGE